MNKTKLMVALLSVAALLTVGFTQTPLKEKLTTRKVLNLATAKAIAAAAEASKNNWDVSIVQNQSRWLAWLFHRRSAEDAEMRGGSPKNSAISANPPRLCGEKHNSNPTPPHLLIGARGFRTHSKEK